MNVQTVDHIVRAARLLVKAYDHIAAVGGRLGSAGIEVGDGSLTLRLIRPETLLALEPNLGVLRRGRYAVVSIVSDEPLEEEGAPMMIMSALFPATSLHATGPIPIESDGEKDGVRLLLDMPDAIRAHGEVREIGAAVGL